MRLILFHLFLFLIPFLLYGLYLYAVKRREALSGAAWEDAPIFWLVVSGVGLMAVSLVMLAVFTGDEPDGSYRPAQFKDGGLVPGRIE